MSGDLHKAGESFATGKAINDIDKQCRLGGCRAANVFFYFDQRCEIGQKADIKHKSGDLILNVSGSVMKVFRVNDSLTLSQVKVVNN